MPCWIAPMANKVGIDAYVWRYMPFEHFVDLVETSELYLRRLDCLDAYDVKEGRWARGVEDLRFTAAVGDPDSLIEALENVRKRTFVSCWSMRLAERRSMWDRLGRPSDSVAAVALHSDLVAALDGNPLDLAIGGVCYMDTLAEFIQRFRTVNTYNLAFCKRREFRAEQEVRLVYQDLGTELLPDHVRTEINLKRLAPRIFLPPESGEPFKRSVEAVIESRKLPFEVCLSRL